MLPDIDFQKIRTFKNSKNNGFEEFSVQLFRSCFKPGTRFYRVDDAGGDGGVEDIAYVNGGKKIGLQAKFFDKLNTSQWRQINRSVKTALKNHAPSLLEYRIFTPVNRSKKSKTWDNYVEKWKNHAKSLGYKRAVLFEWVGDSDIREILVDAKHRDKIYYWFGCPQFSETWLQQKFKIAIQNLDDRYTPKNHIKTEAEHQLSAFALTEDFKKTFLHNIKSVVNSGIETLNALKGTNVLSREKINTLESVTKEAQTIFKDLDVLPERPLVDQIISKYTDSAESLWEELRVLRTSEESKNPSSRHDYISRPFSSEIHWLDKLFEPLNTARSFLHKYLCYDHKKLLVRGEAGTGKSHLLGAFVQTALSRNQSSVLLLGDQFTSQDEPFSQLIKVLGWDHSVDAFLSVLSCHASVVGIPAIIAIDALNESSFRSLWHSHLNGFAAKISEYSNLRLLISCRSDFIPITLPDSLAKLRDESWGEIEHYGFGEQIFEAVSTYFEAYKVKSDHFPPLLEEFQNPLFLKTFCEAFENDSIPSGPLSFDAVMKKRIDVCTKSITESIGCPGYKTKDAINLLAKALSQNNGQAVPHDEIRPLIDGLFSGSEESKSLFHHLRSKGFIFETSSSGQAMVRFPYERFSDYFIVNQILEKYENKDALVEAFKDTNQLAQYADSYHQPGLLRMFAILLPERFGCEFIRIT